MIWVGRTGGLILTLTRGCRETTRDGVWPVGVVSLGIMLLVVIHLGVLTLEVPTEQSSGALCPKSHWPLGEH